MKFRTILPALAAAGSVSASVIPASYDAGVAPTAGTTGAANPTAQGWTAVGGVTGFSHGLDSTNGGWRITDGTSGQPYFYQDTLSALDAAVAASNGWIATWTTALNADAVQDTGVPNGVNDYYSSVPSRQNNNALWIEFAGAHRYILTYNTDSNGDIFLDDGTNSFQITNTGGNLSEELGTGAPAVTYVSYSLVYDLVSGDATLTDSLGGNHGVVSTNGAATQNRVVWGATSSGGQGSTTWNAVALAVPEASESSLIALSGLGLALFRRRNARRGA